MGKFIPCVTNEGTDKSCYKGGGWDFTPMFYAISSTDILSPYIVDGVISIEGLKALKTISKETMQYDGNIWYRNNFSFVTKANDSTLTHRIVIPTNALTTGSQEIKTIYFVYKNTQVYDEQYVYAVACAKESILYEAGTSKSYFFTFTLSKDKNVNNFFINYSYPELIEEHNQDENAHVYNLKLNKNTNQIDKKVREDALLLRNGDVTATNFLKYNNSKTFSDDRELVSKEYVDSVIANLKYYNDLR